MTKIICDSALREKLHDLAKPLELCDEAGHVLARVVPVLDLELEASSEPQITGEELDRRIASRGKTRTTAEVLAYLALVMFQVEWLDEAIDELAAIWTRADSEKRRAITEASAALDRELRTNPQQQGESRGGRHRVRFAPPLGVFFRVDEEQRIVWVGHIWAYRERAN